MAALKNPKYEVFAQARAKGKTADAAYKAAGYKPHRGNAARMSANESIRARVTELQERAAERMVKNRARVLSDLARNADHAFEIGQISASTQALVRYGQEAHGMFVNRHLVGTKRLEDMTETELLALLGEDAGSPAEGASSR